MICDDSLKTPFVKHITELVRMHSLVLLGVFWNLRCGHNYFIIFVFKYLTDWQASSDIGARCRSVCSAAV